MSPISLTPIVPSAAGMRTWYDICRVVEGFTGIATAGDALVHAQAGCDRVLLGADPSDPARQHVWSFLEPITSLTIPASGAGTVAMPAGFNGLVDIPEYVNGSGGTTPLDQVAPEEIFGYWRMSASTGAPNRFAIIAVTSDGTAPQTWAMIVSPKPDKDYTWTFRYNQSAPTPQDALTSYPLGFSQMGLLFEAAALAHAEFMVNRTTGVHEARYRETFDSCRAFDLNLFQQTGPASIESSEQY